VATVTSTGSGFSGGVIVPAPTTTQVSVAVSWPTFTLIAVVSRTDGGPGTATGQVTLSFLHYFLTPGGVLESVPVQMTAPLQEGVAVLMLPFSSGGAHIRASYHTDVFFAASSSGPPTVTDVSGSLNGASRRSGVAWMCSCPRWPRRWPPEERKRKNERGQVNRGAARGATVNLTPLSLCHETAYSSSPIAIPGKWLTITPLHLSQEICAMNAKNPGHLLNFYISTKKLYDKGTKPKDVNQSGEKQSTKLKKSLKGLKECASTGLTTPEQKGDFLAQKEVAVENLTKYCRFLHNNKSGDEKKHAQFTANLKRLTVVVKKLDVNDIDCTDVPEGQAVELGALDDVSTADLDKELTGPETQGEATSSGTAGSQPATDGQQPAQSTTAATKARKEEQEKAGTMPPESEKAAQWKERDARFVPHLKAFLHAGTGDIAGVTKLYNGATDAASKGTYDVANRILDKLEPTIVKGAVTGMVGWQKAKIDTTNQIRQLQTALAKTKRPEAAQVARILDSVLTGLQIHPDSEENLKALETYVATDDIITKAEKPNPWGIKIVIRAPLMKALAGLKK
jgi:hypothetical protein